jgi:transcriptional regulator with XRE-family HTH domain
MVGINVKRLREERGLTQLELADKLAKALTPGLPLGTRHLTPLRLECRVRESRPEVRFWLEFYDTADAGDEA